MHLTRILTGRSWIPLWKRKIPPYPVYVQGNPQNRIFLPMFWMKMVKLELNSPPDFVEFIVHPQMSKLDVKQYLEKIYKIQVLNVRTSLRQGKDVLHPSEGYIITREDDYKVAFVQLGDGRTFEFPNIFIDKSPDEKDMELMQKMEVRGKKKYEKQYDRASLPPWFR
ncbi:hypothetical protein ACJMK2_028141 [Sinanodonta woodiana]|uniref:Large ribosomal subunit protein uL23m n=1 Tax=Sinanodonta woodiana TaxID=1069815 RepID=A0ABD3X7T1_SINWO